MLRENEIASSIKCKCNPLLPWLQGLLLVLLSCAILSNPAIAAPPVNITGKVVYDNGQPAAGISITIKGTTSGTVTNDAGVFKLQGVPNNAVLVLTGVNAVSREIKIEGNSDLGTIVMQEKVDESMQEVTVTTGFQTISKARATGSFGKVENDIISKRPFTNVANALVGQVAGMVADPATGFVIRGRSSLSGASDRTPLLVVDGFPIEGGFSSLNPNDVESVTVLKDAAASSIYGARAANGVIVVTTKGAGAKGKMNVNYNFFITTGGQIDIDNYMNMADSKTQINWLDQWYSVFKGTTAVPDPYGTTNGSFRGTRSIYASLLNELEKGYITKETFDKERERLLNTNYKDQYKEYLLRNAFVQQHNLTLSGSSDKNSYKFNALFDGDLSNYRFNDSKRFLLNFTNIYNISQDIKYTLSANITSYTSNFNGISLGHAGTITQPWTQLVDANGNYTRMEYQNYEPLVKTYEPRLPYHYRYNMLEESHLKDNEYRGTDLRIQNQFDFRIAKDFKFTPMFQYELFNQEDLSKYDEKMYASRNYANIVSRLDTLTGRYLSWIPKGGIYRKNSASRRESFKMRAQLDYRKTFGGKHEVVALAGAEVISTKTESYFREIKFGYSTSSLNYANFNYNTDYVDMFNNAVLENTQSYEGNLIYDYRANSYRQSSIFNERYFAGYANGSYTFDRRYTASFSLRTDASNYISKDLRDKFSPFYSGGLLWNIANEKFMAGAKKVDRLALRATYGVTGLAAGKTSVQAVTVFSTTPPAAETGNLPAGTTSGRDNDFLTWEKTYSTNIGLDFSFFKRKLYGSIDVYNRYTKDVLSSVQTSWVVQSTQSLNLNLGEILNRGIELSIGTDMNITKDLHWSGVLNADYNYNEVLKYDFLATNLFSYLGSNRGGYVVGKPTDYMYMIKLVGTTKDGYFVQQKRNGELVVANNPTNNLADFTRTTIPGVTIDQDDRVHYMGRTTPPVTLGFTNTFSYKGFSLMAIITGKFGHVVRTIDENLVYSFTALNYSASGLAALQSPSLVANTGVGNLYPTRTNQAMLQSSSSLRNFYSDAVVHDASHIRLNEIYLGYDFSNAILGKGKGFFKSLNLFAQGRNLGLLWKANEKGIDPEFPRGSVPPVKLFTFGAKLGM
jgi:TonB-linked SusC/RagA family outer membrane protein